MNKEQGFIALGIGASIAAAYCTYKITKITEENSQKKKYRRMFKTKDVDECSESGLTDIELTILNGEDITESNFNGDQYSESSIPLYKVIISKNSNFLFKISFMEIK